jgi:predicted DCC family thiol-disulfide oxidoreductase YuxK
MGNESGLDAEVAARVEGRALMLFDGQCGFCNRAVQWVIRHDHADRLRFAPQESELAHGILSRRGIDQATMLRDNTVYLVLDAGSPQERILGQSEVQVQLLRLLGGPWRVLGALLRVVPAFLRNGAYRLFARNRYRLSGRYDACPLPTEAERLKFLS